MTELVLVSAADEPSLVAEARRLAAFIDRVPCPVFVHDAGGLVVIVRLRAKLDDRVRRGPGSQKVPGIGMHRMGKDLLRRPRLQKEAAVQHTDPQMVPQSKGTGDTRSRSLYMALYVRFLVLPFIIVQNEPPEASVPAACILQPFYASVTSLKRDMFLLRSAAARSSPRTKHPPTSPMNI